jgi:phosphatidylinositol 4-kinase A
MDFLEFNIHQLVLTDLARNIGESKHSAEDESVSSAIDLVTSKLQTRVVDVETENSINGSASEDTESSNDRVFMASVCLNWQLDDSSMRKL